MAFRWRRAASMVLIDPQFTRAQAAGDYALSESGRRARVTRCAASTEPAGDAARDAVCDSGRRTTAVSPVACASRATTSGSCGGCVDSSLRVVVLTLSILETCRTKSCKGMKGTRKATYAHEEGIGKSKEAALYMCPRNPRELHCFAKPRSQIPFDLSCPLESGVEIGQFCLLLLYMSLPVDSEGGRSAFESVCEVKSGITARRQGFG